MVLSSLDAGLSGASTYSEASRQGLQGRGANPWSAREAHMVDSSGALVPGSGPETPAGRPWRSGLAHIWADSDLSGAHDGAS